MTVEKTILLGVMLALAVLMLAALIAAIRGPRFTDRIVAANAVNTMVISCICLLSVYLEADYLVDVAIVYALLGFTANILLMRLVKAHKCKEEEE